MLTSQAAKLLRPNISLKITSGVRYCPPGPVIRDTLQETFFVEFVYFSQCFFKWNATVRGVQV